MKSKTHRIYALSENTLTLQLNPDISESQIRYLYRLKSSILDRKWPWVYEIIVTFHELSILFDCTSVSFEELQENVRKLLEEEGWIGGREWEPKVKDYTIPVCYDKEMALDQSRLEIQTGLPFSEVVDIHQRGHYILYMQGFLPGFMYLGGLDEKLNCPRLETPRQKIRAGSVGIAGSQTGVYPMESPGGWNIIGRTPLTLFDFSSTSAIQNQTPVTPDTVHIRPLDKITFTAISVDRFEELLGINVVDYQAIIHKSQ